MDPGQIWLLKYFKIIIYKFIKTLADIKNMHGISYCDAIGDTSTKWDFFIPVENQDNWKRWIINC